MVNSCYTSWLAYIEKNKFKIEKNNQNTNWVCKIHRKQVSENNSKKLIILQYRKIFQKITILTIASKFIFTAIIDWNNSKRIFGKIFMCKFKEKSWNLDQFDKSIKSYIKIFEASGLLAHPPAQVGLSVGI